MRLGAVFPLSGPQAALGLGMRDSVRLAVEELNARGGVEGRKVKLVELDDASQPDKCAAVARQLGEDKRILGVVGSYDSACFRAAHPIFAAARLPFIPAGVADRDLAVVGLGDASNEFSILPFGTALMAQAAKYAWDILKARTFAYVDDMSPEGTNAVNQFRYSLGPFFKTVVTGEELVRSPADFPAVVAKIKAAAPQFVFYGGTPDHAGAFLKALREAGVQSAFQDGSHYPAQEFIDAAGARAEGALAVFHGIPPEDFPEGRKYLQAYAAHGYRDPPSIYGIYAYAAAQVMLQAMDRSFLIRPSVVGALKNEQFDSVLGPIRFNWVGSSYQTMAIYQVQRGGWAPIFVSGKGALQPFSAR